MPDIFKKTIQGKEYSFYRTLSLDVIAYYVIFDTDGKRESVKISKNYYGQWTMQFGVSEDLKKQESEFAYAIEENEK